MGGYLSVAEHAGADITVAIAAGAPPSGPVEDDAYEYMVNKIIAAAKKRLRCHDVGSARRDGHALI